MRRSGHQRSDLQEGYRPDLHDLGETVAFDRNPLGLKDLPLPKAPDPSRWLGLCVFVLLSIAMLATAFVVTAAKDKKASLLLAEQRRLQISVDGRNKVLQTWLEGKRSASRRLTESQLFRLFITDTTLQDPKAPLPRSLQDQRPYFHQLMADFARQNDIRRAAVIREDGSILLSSQGPALAMLPILQQLETAKKGWKFLLSPIRPLSDAKEVLAVDAMFPFPAAQAEGDVTREPSAVLVLTLPIHQILGDVLANDVADPNVEKIALLQMREGVIDEIRMNDLGPELVVKPSFGDIRPGTALPFRRLGSQTPVYSLGEPVDVVPWTLYHAVEARAALAPVHEFVMTAAGLSATAVLVLTSGFSAFWWRQGRNHHRELVDLYKAHTRKLFRQHQFLEAIMVSMSDWLTVSSPDGRLVYANPAFAAAVEPTEKSIVGKAWDDLVTEAVPEQPSKNELAVLVDASQFDLIQIGDSRHIVSSKISPLNTDDDVAEGMVRIIRDQTELVQERQRRISAIAQTVDALVHAIELRDPFLLGHTQRLRSHAIAIGRRLQLSSDDLASLALAASLSQVGKIFVPDDILTKPHRHSVEEGEIMKHHILHTTDILERIDFSLPIAGILSQMHERLDGSGYPHGLAGDQICLLARILGAADVFCARTEPRSYRDRMSAGKTLYHLASNDRRYDLKVIQALADIVGHDSDEDDAQQVDDTFIDAAIWQDKRFESGQMMEHA